MGASAYFTTVQLLPFDSAKLYRYYIIMGEEGCHLRVVPPGQLLRRPSTPKPFIEPGFSIFLTCFFVFAFRWLRVFHWGCYVYFRIVFVWNSLYILYIFIFIYFIYFFIVLIVDLLIIPLRFFFLCLRWFPYGILVLDGMSERNHCHIIIFSLHCFTGFSVASWRIMQHVIEKPLPYN